jgi:hypothetical protein
LVIASDSKNILSITKLAEVAKPSLIHVTNPKLLREVNGSSFYASSVKQKPSVNNLGSNHSNRFEKVKV